MPRFLRYVLWGSAGHAKVLADIIYTQGGKVIALFDNYRVPSSLKGVPVFYGETGFLKWAELQSDLKNISGLAAIGGDRGKDRIAIHSFFRRYNINVDTIVHPSAVVSPSAHLGEGTQVLALANVGPDVTVGEGCIINHRASVDHECQLCEGVHLAPGATLCGCVSVGAYAFIGAGAVVLPRLKIGANAVVGAGAVVTRDVPSGVTVVGNPARVIRKSSKING